MSQFPLSPNAPHATADKLQGSLEVLYRHRRKSLMLFVGVMVLTVVATILMPKTYRSEAKLFLRLGRENTTLDPTVMSNPDSSVAVPQSRENEINSVAEMMHSRLLLEKVVDSLGSEALLGAGPLRTASPATSSADAAAIAAAEASNTSPITSWIASLRQWSGFQSQSPRDRAVQGLAKDLDVSVIRRTNVIGVTYDGDSAEVAHAVVNKVIELYQGEHVRLNRNEGAREFLERETNRLRTDLATSEGRLRDLKNTTGLSSVDAQRQTLINQIARLQDDAMKTRASLASARTKVEQMEAQLKDLPPLEVTGQTTGMPNDGTDNMRGQLYSLKIKEQEYAAKFKEGHPLLDEVRRQVAEAERILGQEEPHRKHITTSPNPVYQQVQAALLTERPALTALETESKTLDTQLAAAEKRLQTLNEDELRIAALQRDIQLLETNYKRYASNLEQARIDQSMETQRISSIAVAQPATYDVKPIRPKPMVNLALGFLLAVGGAVGLAFAADYRDNAEVAASAGQRLPMPPRGSSASRPEPEIVTAGPR